MARMRKLPKSYFAETRAGMEKRRAKPLNVSSTGSKLYKF